MMINRSITKFGKTATLACILFDGRAEFPETTSARPPPGQLDVGCLSLHSADRSDLRVASFRGQQTGTAPSAKVLEELPTLAPASEIRTDAIARKIADLF